METGRRVYLRMNDYSAPLEHHSSNKLNIIDEKEVYSKQTWLM